jgi:phospholipid/cholesterol/gamma-HCH transport system substrate-binding protein
MEEEVRGVEERPDSDNPVPTSPARLAAVGAVIAAVVLIAFVMFAGGGNGRTYKLLFDTAGQLVKGNQVLVGGRPIGSIESLRLTNESQAEVTVSVDEPLHEGTTAVIRSSSLSGIANRYISLKPGPDNAEEISEDEVITGEKTISPTDLDQLFNIFDPKTRKGLSDVIEGFSASYAGRGPAANKTFKYLNPALTSTRRLLQELTRDQKVLKDFLVSSSRVVTAVAERRDDLSSSIGNANVSLEAIARRNRQLDRSLVLLPPTLREANTTFVNLRFTLDEVDPLVKDLKPATKDLAPFLRELRPVATKAVPVFRNLRRVVRRSGGGNDLADILGDLPTLRASADTVFDDAIDAVNDSEPTIRFARPYTPDLLGFLTKFGQVTAYYDANGHYARVMPTANNVFSYNAGQLDPIYNNPGQQFDFFNLIPGAKGFFTRCPGGSTQANSGWPAPTDHPFLDDGNLAGMCDPNDVPLGVLP